VRATLELQQPLREAAEDGDYEESRPAV